LSSGCLGIVIAPRTAVFKVDGFYWKVGRGSSMNMAQKKKKKGKINEPDPFAENMLR
jgi:hypothetical protein